MARVRISKAARKDLDEIWLYIGQDSIQTADRFVELLLSKFPLLAAHPELGRKRAELAPDLRSFPVKNYLILYRSRPRSVEIVRLVSGFRDLKNIFR